MNSQDQDHIMREGDIESGDQPLSICSSCKIKDEIYHMVTFRHTAREQIKPRLYKSKTLRKVAVDFLVDFYESQIEWLDKAPSKKDATI